MTERQIGYLLMMRYEARKALAGIAAALATADRATVRRVEDRINQQRRRAMPALEQWAYIPPVDSPAPRRAPKGGGVVSHYPSPLRMAPIESRPIVCTCIGQGGRLPHDKHCPLAGDVRYTTHV